MGLNHIDNCPRCGRIFVKGIKDVCPACVKEIDQMYDKCLEYLRDNRGTNIANLSEETGVSIKQITRFIREGRISLMDAPNMSYPCDVCGILIREGTICDSCRQRLSRDVNRIKEDQRREQQLQEEREARKNTYNIKRDF